MSEHCILKPTVLQFGCPPNSHHRNCVPDKNVRKGEVTNLESAYGKLLTGDAWRREDAACAGEHQQLFKKVGVVFTN